MLAIVWFLLKRFFVSALAVLAIGTITFGLMHSVPGDPFDEPGMPTECKMALRRYYGLEDPLPQQYMRYMSAIARFEFGPSLKFPSQHVNDIIASSFPISAILGVCALALAVPMGIILGTLFALRKDSWIDVGGIGVTTLGLSTPSFVVAMLLQFLFSICLPLFPVARWGTWAHAVLPAIALAIGPMCMIAKLLRASMLEVCQQQHVHTAHTKGLVRQHIMCFHVWKNALLPVLSYLGPVTANVLVGSFIVERVFGIPGLGQWFTNGVLTRDYAVIGGLTVFYAIVLMVSHTVIDLINGLIDPRLNIIRRIAA